MAIRLSTGGQRLVFLFVAVIEGITDDSYKACPEYPPVAPSAAVATDAGVQTALAQVDALLTHEASKLPSGMVATVVYDQATLFSKGYGRRDAFDPTSAPPSDRDLVRIASITKVFTDILLYQLRDEGIVSLDDPLAKHMSGFQMQRAPGSHTRGTITLRGLASHTSGLPREVPYPCSLSGQCNETEVLSLLAMLAPVMAPARRFHYSNLGLALLGRALGHAARGAQAGAYESLIRDIILEPLGMKNASFDFNNATKSRMATGTAADGTKIDFSKILDGDTIHEMLSAAILLRDGSSAVGTPWEMKYSSGVWMKSKQGELPGYRSSVTIVEPLKVGIFVSALVSDVEELSVWTIPALDLLVPSLKKALWHLHKPSALPPGYAAYVGRYYDGSVRVLVEDVSLVLRLGTQPPLNLTVAANNSGNVLRARPANLSAGCRWLDDGTDQELVYFEMEDGECTGLRFMDGRFGRLPSPADSPEFVL